MHDEATVCAWCGTGDNVIFVCGRCEGESYCSETCQRACWKAHKKVCSELVLQRSSAPKPEAQAPPPKEWPKRTRRSQKRQTSQDQNPQDASNASASEDASRDSDAERQRERERLELKVSEKKRHALLELGKSIELTRKQEIRREVHESRRSQEKRIREEDRVKRRKDAEELQRLDEERRLKQQMEQLRLNAEEAKRKKLDEEAHQKEIAKKRQQREEERAARVKEQAAVKEQEKKAAEAERQKQEEARRLADSQRRVHQEDKRSDTCRRAVSLQARTRTSEARCADDRGRASSVGRKRVSWSKEVEVVPLNLKSGQDKLVTAFKESLKLEAMSTLEDEDDEGFWDETSIAGGSASSSSRSNPEQPKDRSYLLRYRCFGGDEILPPNFLAFATTCHGHRQKGHKADDWECPNPDCGNHCFTRKKECPLCRTPKPTSPTEGLANDKTLPEEANRREARLVKAKEELLQLKQRKQELLRILQDAESSDDSSDAEESTEENASKDTTAGIDRPESKKTDRNEGPTAPKDTIPKDNQSDVDDAEVKKVSAKERLMELLRKRKTHAEKEATAEDSLERTTSAAHCQEVHSNEPGETCAKQGAPEKSEKKEEEEVTLSAKDRLKALLLQKKLQQAQREQSAAIGGSVDTEQQVPVVAQETEDRLESRSQSYESGGGGATSSADGCINNFCEDGGLSMLKTRIRNSGRDREAKGEVPKASPSRDDLERAAIAKRTLELMEARRLVDLSNQSSSKRKRSKSNSDSKRCGKDAISRKMEEEYAAAMTGPRFLDNKAVVAKRREKSTEAARVKNQDSENDDEVADKLDKKTKASKSKKP